MSTSPCFLWVTDFPLFTLSDPDKAELSNGRWSSTHHPFTAPTLESLPQLQEALTVLENASQAEQSALLERLQDVIGSIRGQHYDLVLDGVELGGGSVRVHSSSLQRRILSSILQLSNEELSRFDHLLRALDSGCPPHGGIALGFDRLMAILTTEPGQEVRSIRDVIAFPKTSGGKDPLFRSPSAIGGDEGSEQGDEGEAATLKQYGLRRL